MKKYLFLSLVTIFGWSLGLSQDMIRLRDGSWISGKVISNIKGDSLRYLALDSHFVNIPSSDVRRIVNDKRRRPFDFPDTGLFAIVQGRATIGNFFAAALGMGLQVTVAKRLQGKYALGLGVGLETLYFHNHVPVTVDGRWYFRPCKTTGFLHGQVGYAVPIGDFYWESRDWWSKPFGRHWGGPTASLEIGVQNQRWKHFGFTLSAGLRFQYLYSEYGGKIVSGEIIQGNFPESLPLLIGQTGFGILMR